MLNKRDEKTLHRLIQGNGISDVLEALSLYAFEKIDGKSDIWLDIFGAVNEAKAKTRRLVRANECRQLGISYDPDEDNL